MLALAAVYWLETIAAVALAGLAGGWILWPFRGPHRPYLYLAAPTAGIALLSLTLTILHRSFGLSVQVALAVALPLLCAPTLFCLGRWYVGGSKPHRWTMPLVVAVGVMAWAVWCCNRSTILAGGPTVCTQDGSDAFGYAQVADWWLAHPSEQPSCSATRPLQARACNGEGDFRPGAYLLNAVGAHVRGSRALFAYDWAAGVALGAGVLALAGAFAPSRAGLVLLTCAGIVSTWMTYSRSGYLGKLLAYPGSVLLVHLVLATGQRFTAPRLLVCVTVGPGVALCHNVLTPFVLVGLALAGAVAAVVFQALLSRPSPQRPEARLRWRFLLLGACTFLSAVGPLLAVYPLRANNELVRVDLPAHRLFAIIFDLDNPHVPLVGRTGAIVLLTIALGLQALLCVLACQVRCTLAAGLCLSAIAVPLAWKLSPSGAYQLTGVPSVLAIAGVVLLVDQLRRQRRVRWLQWTTLALGIVLVGLRLPQASQSFLRYVTVPVESPYVYRESELDTIADLARDHTLELRTGDLYASIVAMTELGHRLSLQIRSPAWERAIGTYWPPPDYSSNGDYVLLGPDARCPAGVVIHRSCNYLLVRRKLPACGREVRPRLALSSQAHKTTVPPRPYASGGRGTGASDQGE